MTLAALSDLAALLKTHQRPALEVYRSLNRVHEHQRRAGIKPSFPIRMLVGRAYRASVNGDRLDSRGKRGRPQRYVTEDGRLVTF
jgi:hypothetical protein